MFGSFKRGALDSCKGLVNGKLSSWVILLDTRVMAAPG